jgi:putative (di)nucleoside polyphosphate hydrolase
MNIIKKVKELNFSFGEYVIVGGGILEALGLRNTNDIDVAVMPNLLKKLRESGKYKEEIKWGKLFLTGDNIDIIAQLNWEDYSTKTEDAIKTATIIEGVPFLNLQETIKYKKALGREKDLRDIELIKNHLEEYKKLADNLPYRKNVGSVIFKGNKFLLVLMPIKSFSDYWKFPQGGVNEGEKRREAVMRELKEELGTDKFKIIKQYPYKHRYDWDETSTKSNGYKWRGQKQTFFLVEFLGTDKDIKIDKEEISKYGWFTKEEVLEIVDKKHILYKGYKKLAEKLLNEQ